MTTIAKGKIDKIYFRRQYDQEIEWLFYHEKGETKISYQSTIILRSKGWLYS